MSEETALEGLQVPPGGSTNESALSALGISPDEVDAFNLENVESPKNKHVCICGHAVNKHIEYAQGRLQCQTAKMICPCKGAVPVLLASDTRFFMRKTYGFGFKHALARGIRAMEKAGKSGKWLVVLICFKCERTDKPVKPAAMTAFNTISETPTDKNIFLCDDCFLNLRFRR